MALCAANVIIICLTPVYLTRPNCLRELRWSLDFAARGMKRVVLLPLHPAVTFHGVARMTKMDSFKGLIFSSREKSAMNLSCAALELLTHVKFKSQMTQLPCHELQVTLFIHFVLSASYTYNWIRLGQATLSKMIGMVVTWSHPLVKRVSDLFDQAVSVASLTQ